MVAEAGLEPAADEAYETPALPTELFRGVKVAAPLGFEPSRPSSKPGALPTRRRGKALVPRAGFEPASSDLKDRGPRPLDERGDVERAAKIELASSAWKAAALPLSYARVADGAGIEPARPNGSRRVSTALPYRSANHPQFELEPSG